MLDDIFASLFGFIGIEPEFSACTALAKEIPALIERNLKFMDAVVLVI